MDINNYAELIALPIDEPVQIGGIKVATNKYDTIPNSLFVMIWDNFRMMEKEYDIPSGQIISRQVSTQQGETFGEKLENDSKMHKYAYSTEVPDKENDVEIYKEYHDGILNSQERRKLILDNHGKVIQEDWETIQYKNGIAAKPTYSTIKHEILNIDE